MKTLIVIPARMESRRLPGKPLREIVNGKTLLGLTLDTAIETEVGSLITSSDPEIETHCKNCNIWYAHTSDDLPTGTHRCAAAVAAVAGSYDVVINWQVDEPLAPSDAIPKLVEAIKLGADIATLVAPIGIDEARNPHVVKTIVLGQGNTATCRWFSRAPMGGAFGHCGVYAFRTYRGDVLKRLAKLESTPLSRFERLEQLAWIEAGHRIVAVPIAELPPAVNVEADLEIVRKHYEAARQGANQDDLANAGAAHGRG